MSEVFIPQQSPPSEFSVLALDGRSFSDEPESLKVDAQHLIIDSLPELNRLSAIDVHTVSPELFKKVVASIQSVNGTTEDILKVLYPSAKEEISSFRQELNTAIIRELGNRAFNAVLIIEDTQLETEELKSPQQVACGVIADTITRTLKTRERHWFETLEIVWRDNQRQLLRFRNYPDNGNFDGSDHGKSVQKPAGFMIEL